MEPENYVNGGTGQSKFVAQPYKVNLGGETSQRSKTQ